MITSDFNPDHQNLSTESKIVASLERISQAFRVLLWNESKENALTPIQVQVLVFLRFHQDELCKVSHLAREFDLTKATISETIKTLETKGLIFKGHEPADTRSFVIGLTERGKEIADKTSLFSQEILKPVAKLSVEQKEELLTNLLQIIRHLHHAGIITIQRMCFSCRHYKADAGKPGHFCRLLNRSLLASELRIDCPEHQTAVS